MTFQPPTSAVCDRDAVTNHGLREFIRQAWSFVEPAPYHESWHIGAMCEVLEALQQRQIPRLIITVPPGLSKSLVANTFYPPWCWLIDPTEQFICVSYDQKLSERHAKRHRDLCSTDWYFQRSGVSVAPNAPRSFFKNSAGGSRFSTSIGGGVTGHHAHQILVDDLIRPDACRGSSEESRVILDNASEYFRHTLMTRQADPTRTAVCVIGQRLHDEDPQGRLINEGGWTVLSLPMRYAGKACVILGKNFDPRTVDGELLDPVRFPEPTVRKLELDLGRFASAQLAQDPQPSTGGIFQASWFDQFWSTTAIPGTFLLPERFESIVISCDLSFKGEATSDYCVFQCWGRWRGKYYLLDQIRAKMSCGAATKALREFEQRHPGTTAVLVESAANGPAVMDALAKEISNLVPVIAHDSKESRANAISGIFEAKNVVLPHRTVMPGVDEFISEFLRFPRGKHDDQVDAAGHGLSRLRQNAAAIDKYVGAAKVLRSDTASWAAIMGGHWG